MSQSMKYILVTGTNGGLGLGICMRLIDDFLKTNPSSTSLTLIFTTRSSRKGADTQKALESHLSQQPSTSKKRIHLQPENVELTNLLSIRALSKKLLASDISHLNSVILNAGIGGWAGLNWPQAIADVLLNTVTSTTWPDFKLGIAGLITEPQFSDDINATLTKNAAQGEPPLAQVFCANIFGHYMLVHWLMPLLRACETVNPGRIIWVGSIEARQKHFKEDDMTGLRTMSAYESTKRLTDILALSYSTSTAKSAYAEYTAIQSHVGTAILQSEQQHLSIPTMHVAHPGICNTSIVSIPWIMAQVWGNLIYFARWIGSPWITISTYLAAMCFTWIALAPTEEIKNREAKYGNNGSRVKWGTSANRLGKESVQPTEVEGWGLNGSGEEYVKTWWAGKRGRAPGVVDTSREDVGEFVALGGRVWREMETMRVDWERRIEEYDRIKG